MIKGFIGTSLIDFPGKIASVVFFGGCNYRCPFCQNTWLVAEQKVSTLPDLPIENVVKMALDRSKMTEGVVLSGGEPTLYPAEISQFVYEIRRSEKGKHLKMKLDTNGSHPEVLQELINKGAVDYVAIDLKTSPAKYDAVAGLTNSFEKVQKSLEILTQSSVDSEVRSTFVPGLIDKPELSEMIPYISKAKRFFIQPFRAKETLDESYTRIIPYTEEYMQLLADFVRSKTAAEVVLR